MPTTHRGVGVAYALDPRCDGQDEGPPRGNAQLGGGASSAPADTLVGYEKQSVATPLPTPGGHLHLQICHGDGCRPKARSAAGQTMMAWWW